jgi:YHS domain-containing protein
LKITPAGSDHTELLRGGTRDFCHNINGYASSGQRIVTRHSMSAARIPDRLKALFLMLCAALLLGASGAFAADVNVDSNGVAIQGYDPVAYFTQDKAVKGSNNFRAEHEGAIYLFATAENLAAFTSDPQKYAPAYGGYCAFGLASGYKAEIEPDAFTITGGKLYLNYNEAVRDAWRKDIPGFVEKADANWPGLGG